MDGAPRQVHPAAMACGCAKRYGLLDAALDTLRGDFAAPDLQRRRLAACGACTLLSRRGTCRSCGCLVRLKVKYARARCDLGRW
jgi:hypothetical protein